MGAVTDATNPGIATATTSSEYDSAYYKDANKVDPGFAALNFLLVGIPGLIKSGADAFDHISGTYDKRRNDQLLLNRTTKLNADAHTANVNAADAGAKLQKDTAQSQYDLATGNENTKVQTDDALQLKAIDKIMADSTLTLAQKLAYVDDQIASGLGTESTKLARQAKELAQQQYDLYGVGGAADLQKQQMDEQARSQKAQLDETARTQQETLDRNLSAARDNIMYLGGQRDASLATTDNVNTGLGISGEAANRQQSSASYQADRQLRDQALQAGYVLEQTPGELANKSVFDQAMSKALVGRNIINETLGTQIKFNNEGLASQTKFNNLLFDANLAKAKNTLRTNEQGFSSGIDGLISTDTTFRASALLGLDSTLANADLALTNAKNGADFSFESSNIQTDRAQFQINETADINKNFLLGVSQAILWASNPSVGAAASGFGKWWGSQQTGAPA